METLSDEVELLQQEVGAAEKAETEAKDLVAEKEAELEQAEVEATAVEEASNQTANVRVLLSIMSSTRRARKKRSSENITRPETCAQLINMTAEMSAAFLLNTDDGITSGSLYAKALLEEPTPTCSAEELVEIK